VLSPSIFFEVGFESVLEGIQILERIFELGMKAVGQFDRSFNLLQVFNVNIAGGTDLQRQIDTGRIFTANLKLQEGWIKNILLEKMFLTNYKLAAGFSTLGSFGRSFGVNMLASANYFRTVGFERVHHLSAGFSSSFETVWEGLAKEFERVFNLGIDAIIQFEKEFPQIFERIFDFAAQVRTDFWRMLGAKPPLSFRDCFIKCINEFDNIKKCIIFCARMI